MEARRVAPSNAAQADAAEAPLRKKRCHLFGDVLSYGAGFEYHGFTGRSDPYPASPLFA